MERQLVIDELLEVLYDVAWGDPEALKRIVVTVQSHTVNTSWTKDTIEFLKDVACTLRNAWVIDERKVQECLDLQALHNLNEFQGVVCADVKRRYKIVEVNGDSDDE